MPNNYYERLSEMNPGELADGLAIEQEFDAIGRGFAKLPVPHRDGRGFEGPTRVGDPVEKTDAVNLGGLEKLNLPIYRKKITTEDWNTITDAGIYDVVNASGANSPNSYPYGVLVVHVFNGVATQLYYPDDNGVLNKRVCKSILLQNWASWDQAYSLSMGSTGFRNKLINGGFIVNQRNYQSGAATSAGKYTLDRWKVSGPGGITFSTSNGNTIVTIPPGQTINQVIEGINLPAGDYVLSWSGSALGRVNNGQYGTSGNVRVTLSGGVDTSIEFSSGTLGLVQFELGLTVQPFEYRSISYEAILCKRYYRSLDCGGRAYSALGVGYFETLSAFHLHSDISGMRAIPTVAASGAFQIEASGATANFISGSPSGQNFMRIDFSSSITWEPGRASGLRDAGQANAKITFDAEM